MLTTVRFSREKHPSSIAHQFLAMTVVAHPLTQRAPQLICGLMLLVTIALPASADEQPPALQPDVPAQILAAARAEDHRRVVQLADQHVVREQVPAEQSSLLYWIARSRFCQGDLAGSQRDFERLVVLRPERERELWELGIVYYYTGNFAQGARQFELYQTYYDEDVENSVWRFLCQRHVDGTQQARQQMLPIERDRRIPMMEIYRLFRGESTPEQVLAAAETPATSATQLKQQRFFAHLYLGLFHEAQGNTESSLDHLQRAVADFDQSHYMWRVAKVHAELRSRSQDQPAAAK